MDFQELSNAFDKVTKGLNAEVDRIFEVMKPDFIEANKRALMRGQKSDGSYLSVLRNPFYVDYKERKGSKAAMLTPPRSDLKDTGSFQSKMVAQVSPTEISILSTDSKMPKLVAKEGIDIFGVQEQELPTLQTTFAKHLNNYIDAIVL